MKASIGFFIRRSVRDVDAVRGKTFAAYPHILFVNREHAQYHLNEFVSRDDSRFTYDVCEAFMIIDEEQGQ